MGDTAINVPVEVRSHELTQLQDILVTVSDELDDAELHDEADELYRIYDEHVEGLDGGIGGADFVSMPPSDWRTVVTNLSRARGESTIRIGWLQNKLMDRLDDKLSELNNE